MESTGSTMRPILPLSQADISQITSSVVITNLRDVVSALVQNSLDSGARKLDITVNFQRGDCTVEDDGCGIAASDFKKDGGLFKRHHTSKRGSADLHGRDGVFLASLAALSLVTVVSRQATDVNVSYITVHHSQAKDRESNPLHHQHFFHTSGTRVVVRNLFGNMPVRVKQRAMHLKTAEGTVEWSNLRHELVALALAWPDPISIVLLDEPSSQKLVLRTSSASVDAPGASARLSRLERQLSILTHAAIIEVGSWQSWVPVAASTFTLSIKGAISLDPAATKLCQFLSFGVQPCRNQGETNELYIEINRVFANSHFGIVEDTSSDKAELERQSKDRRFKGGAFTDKQLKGGRRGADRWPMFYLKVTFKDSQGARHNSDAESRLDTIVDLIRAMVTQWLVEHQLRPREWRSRSERKEEQQSRPATSVKNPTLANIGEARRRVPPLTFDHVFASQTRKRPLWEPDTTNNPSPLPVLNDNEHAQKVDANGYISWTDPVTSGKFLVDSRTGTAVPVIGYLGGASKPTDISSAGRKSMRLETYNTVKPPSEESSAWLQTLLKDWKNPVFAAPETKVRSVQPELFEEFPVRHSCSGWHGGCDADEGVITLSELKLSVAEIRNATVISQLDSKFILIGISGITDHSSRMRYSGSSYKRLVIVDQHAADERIKIESLLRDLCSGSTAVRLEHPLLFEIPTRDAKLLAEYTEFFASWSIKYQVHPKSSRLDVEDTGGSKVTVTALPAGITERCIATPKLLIELLRAEVWKRAGCISKQRSTMQEADRTSSDKYQWLKDIAMCPSGLIDMLNSRACRSAIMFNDKLTVLQCEELIRDLSTCALPFQCAHGRPSMVPLIDLGDEDRGGEHVKGLFGEELEASDFASAYKQWCSK